MPDIPNYHADYTVRHNRTDIRLWPTLCGGRTATLAAWWDLETLPPLPPLPQGQPHKAGAAKARKACRVDRFCRGMASAAAGSGCAGRLIAAHQRSRDQLDRQGHRHHDNLNYG